VVYTWYFILSARHNFVMLTSKFSHPFLWYSTCTLLPCFLRYNKCHFNDHNHLNLWNKMFIFTIGRVAFWFSLSNSILFELFSVLLWATWNVDLVRSNDQSSW
jgi:hypothetical protein